MYGVPDAVIEAYKTDGIHKEFRVVIGSTSYGNDVISDDSIDLKQSILDNENFEAIGCIASSLSVELRAQFSTKIRGRRVRLYVKAGNTQELQIFDGYIEKCTKTANGWRRTIEAYDVLYKLSGQSGLADENEKKKYDVTEWFNTHADVSISNLLSQLCSKFSVPLRTGNKPLVNGSLTTHCGRNHTVSSLSALDLLKDIMQINGCFGYITGDGYFSWKYLLVKGPDGSGWLYPSQYINPTNTIYPGQDTRHAPSPETATNFIGEYESLAYQDFEMLPINVVKIRNYDDDKEAGMYREGEVSSDENTYIIQGNPIVYDYDKSAKDNVAHNVYDMLSKACYVPFESTLPGLPYLECGDEVNFYDFVDDYGTASIQRFHILTRTLSGGQRLKDSYTAQGNEYLHEFITGTATDSSGLRDELENNYDTSDEVDEKIANAAGLYNIVTVASYADIPDPPSNQTLYCVQGEVSYYDPDNPDPEPEENQNEGE